MPLRHRRLADISVEDIDLLIRNKVVEQRTVDYKSELPGSASKQRKDFLADVVSFANTGGGDILYGVEEQGGRPIAVLGIKDPDADKATQRLQEMITTGIRPRLSPKCDIHSLEIDDSSYVLILRVPQSVQAPHMVSFESTPPFHSRLNVRKHAMDIDEIRDSFLRSAERPERVRAFHAARLVHYATNNYPADLRTSPRLIAHLIPFYAFDRRIQLATEDLPKLDARVRPLFSSDWQLEKRFNLDGLVARCKFGEFPDGVVQFFRNGSIETAAPAPVIGEGTDRKIPSRYFEDGVIEWVRNALGAGEEVGLQTPLVFMLTLDTMKPCRLEPVQRQFRATTGWFDRTELPLPEVIIEDSRADPAKELKPMFDALWNAAGFARSFNYAESGERLKV